MALTNSWPGVTAAATTTDARKNLAGLIARDAAGAVRSGVFPSSAAALVSARSDMNLDIAAFTGAAVQFGGPILIANDGVAQLPSPLVSPGAGTNFYVVYAKQNESTAPGTDASNTKVFGAQLSTSSFAAARAALPAGALELGTVQMPTGKTATNNAGVVITQTHQYTAAAGGTVWVRNGTELSAWAPEDGAVAWLMDSDLLVVRSGGAWKLTAPIETRVTFDTGTGVTNGTTIQVLNFPALPFDTIVDIDCLMQVGNTSVSAGTYVPGMSGSTGGTTTELPLSLYPVPSGEWRAVPRDARLVIPANTVATHTTIASSTQNGQWRGALRTNRRSA